MLDSIKEEETKKTPQKNASLPFKRRIKEVVQNTTLGRIVLADPERGKKYGLKVVPAWKTNRSWPPPPVKPHCIGERQKHEPTGTFEASSAWSKLRMVQAAGTVFHQSLSLRRKVSEDETKQSNIDIQVGKGRLSTQTGSIPLPSFGEQLETDAWLQEHMVDFDMDEAVAKMTKQMRDYYWMCFQRYDADGGGSLDAQEMQKMMKDMGLAPTSYSEQKVYARMLQDIAERSEGERNPLLEGGWTFEEFLLMITVMMEVTRVQEEHTLLELCDVLGFSEEELLQFREVFDQFDEDASGDIEIRELKNILQVLGQESSTEEIRALLQSQDIGNGDKDDESATLDFPEFLKLMKRLSGDIEEKAAKARITELPLLMVMPDMEEQMAD
jgi:Ca2+-binding EF-hand superfamily protein